MRAWIAKSPAWPVSLLLHGVAAAGLACAIGYTCVRTYEPAHVVFDVQSDHRMPGEEGGAKGGSIGPGAGSLRASLNVTPEWAGHAERSELPWPEMPHERPAPVLSASACDFIVIGPATNARTPTRDAAAARARLKRELGQASTLDAAGENPPGVGGLAAGSGVGSGEGNGTGGGGTGSGSATGNGNGTGDGSGNGAGQGVPGGIAEGATTQPQVIGLAKPEYPLLSRERGESGDVLLAVSIGADGARGSVQVLRSSGYARLDRAARSALERARFIPAQQNGHPVASVKSILISFRLEDGAM